MIRIQVQFEPKGELHTYMAPDDTEHGDEVIVHVPGEDRTARALVIAIGSHDLGRAEPVLEVVSPLAPREDTE